METREFWRDLIKRLKEKAVTQDDSGDLAPVILLEKNNRIKIIIESPVIDKKYGYWAIDIAHKFLPFDALSLLIDAHIAFANGSEQETLERFQPGEMQRMCDEENACERGLITDVIVVSRFRNGNASSQIIPYSYHGKGSQFLWLDDQEKYALLKEMDDKTQISGDIIETVQIILKQPSLATLDETTAKIGFQLLTRMGFKINLVDLAIPA